MNFSKKQNKKTKISRAFTLIEMLFVLAIFGILTSVVLFEYANFNSQIIMNNTVYEVALTTRQAQVYALGTRQQEGLEGFYNRYGVYFDLNKSDGDKNFIFFIDAGGTVNFKESSIVGGPLEGDNYANNFCDDDLDGDSAADEVDCYTCSGGECLEKLTLSRDIEIEKICVSGGTSFDSPYDLDGECEAYADQSYDLVVTFERPDPSAIITTPINDSRSGTEYTSASIVIKNKFGNRRAVLIKNTGQVSVEVLNGD